MERRNALLILRKDRWRIFAFERRSKMTYQSKKHKEVFDKAMVKKNAIYFDASMNGELMPDTDGEQLYNLP